MPNGSLRTPRQKVLSRDSFSDRIAKRFTSGQHLSQIEKLPNDIVGDVFLRSLSKKVDAKLDGYLVDGDRFPRSWGRPVVIVKGRLGTHARIVEAED